MQAKRQVPQAVNLSVWIYQALVRLYPADFRTAYGEWMVQAFRDSCLRASRSGGLLSLWVRTLVDVFLSVIEQYANRGAVMTRSKWILLSGWFLTASSVFIVIGWLASTRPTYNIYNAASWSIDRFLNAAVFPMIFLGLLSVLIGLLGLRARFEREASDLGRGGLIISLIGTAAAMIGIVGTSIKDASPWWETSMIGVTLLFVGLGLFGSNCVQRKLFQRWNSLPLIISLPWPLILLADILFDSITGAPYNLPVVLTVFCVIAPFLGLALIGYLMLSDQRAVQPALS